MENNPVTIDLLDQSQATLLGQIETFIARAPGWLNPEKPRHGCRRRERVIGPGCQRQLMRMQLGQLVLELATAILDNQADVTQLVEDVAKANRKLMTMARLGEGWIEERPVWRPRIRITIDPSTKESR